MFVNQVKSTVLPVSKPVVVDQLAGQRFQMSQSGFPLNDLSVVVRSQNYAELERILQSQAFLRAQAADNVGRSVSDIISDILPKGMQTPSELARYSEFLAQRTVRTSEPSKTQESSDTIKFDASEQSQSE